MNAHTVSESQSSNEQNARVIHCHLVSRTRDVIIGRKLQKERFNVVENDVKLWSTIRIQIPTPDHQVVTETIVCISQSLVDLCMGKNACFSQTWLWGRIQGVPVGVLFECSE